MKRSATRRRPAAGSAARDPARSVFINCPFDPEYRPLFDAIVFATVSCKYLPQGHFYKQCVSDLGAYDLLTHENTVRSMVQAVMSWLSTRADATVAVDPDKVMERMEDFQQELEMLRRKWNETNVRWSDMVEAARAFAPRFY